MWVVLLIRLPFNTCLYNDSNVVFGGEHIIINRYDVNMMLPVNLYNPYGANKPNYILCGWIIWIQLSSWIMLAKQNIWWGVCIWLSYCYDIIKIHYNNINLNCIKLLNYKPNSLVIYILLHKSYNKGNNIPICFCISSLFHYSALHYMPYLSHHSFS